VAKKAWSNLDRLGHVHGETELAPVSTGHLGIVREAWGYPQAQAYVGRLPEDRGHHRRGASGRWTTEEKLRIVDETLRSGESISVLARRHGVAPNLLYRWRRLMTEGGAVAVQADDAVTGNAELRRLDERMRELERQLGRKTLEVEILKEALARSRTKKPSLLATSPLRDDFR